MEKFKINKDIKVFGEQVHNTPQGIGEAFEALKKMLPFDDNRTFYGICHCSSSGFKYIAAAEEKLEGEGERYNLETFTIERGEYFCKTVKGWTENLNLIREAFASFGDNPEIDNSKPLIEVYKSINEMMCMVKLRVMEHTVTMDI